LNDTSGQKKKKKKGGRFRTGKHRPKIFFKQKKKTCLLSHIRLGNYKTAMYQVLQVMNKDAQDLRIKLEDRRMVFDDCLYSMVALPEVCII
jgi:hypothetical protein